MEQTSGAHALEYAGFWRRLVSLIIDIILISAVTSVIFPFRWFPAYGYYGNWFFIPHEVLDTISSGLAFAVYSVLFWAWRGQTPGKIVMGIKILRADGSKITFGYSLLRYLGYMVSVLMLGIGFLWIAFDARKQGIHDKIGDTVVVILPQSPHRQAALTSPKPSAG